MPLGPGVFELLEGLFEHKVERLGDRCIDASRLSHADQKYPVSVARIIVWEILAPPQLPLLKPLEMARPGLNASAASLRESRVKRLAPSVGDKAVLQCPLVDE